MKKILLLFFVLTFALSFSTFNVVKADTTSSADVAARINLINQLNQQIQALQAQLNASISQQQSNMIDLARFLRQGSSGDDVMIVQAILAADATIYPEGKITGYFGPATARAIARFQAKYGISAVGYVGPQTLAKLKEVRNDNDVDIEVDAQTNQRIACAKVPPGHLIAPGWLRNNNNNKPIVPACQILPPGIAGQLGVSGQLAVSAVTVTNVSPTTAAINWTTNANATSKVYYSTTSPVNLSTAIVVNNDAMTQVHVMNLSGLAANTTYYYIVSSQDALGRVSVSGQQQFTTSASGTVDITPPVISAINVTNVTGTSATINWTTNESANSKVYYSTVSGVNTSTTTSVSDNALVTAHSIVLSNLSANTTYYFIVSSQDASANVGISAESSLFTSVSVGDTTAPIISGVTTNSVTSSSAGINWTTNENATSKVYYSTTSPVNLSAAATMTGDASVTNHVLNLVGLSANTTYYFMVESKDSSGNTSISTQYQFTTSASGDVNPPVISAITVTATTSTSATINWTTNKSASSKVYYSTSASVDLNTSASVSDNNLVTAHLVNLTGLSANTTYYFIVSSTDASGNVSLSAQQQFTTSAS